MNVHYECAGTGPPLLMLHGIGSNRRAFRQQLSGLSDAFACIAWDAPGYGLSDDPLEPVTLETIADCAVELLDTLHLEQVHVLGVSMGGVVAQLVYGRHPRRVRSLILVDTNTGGGGLPEPERSIRVQQRLDAIDRLGPRGMAEERAPRLVTAEAPADLVRELADIMAEVHPSGYRAAAIALGAADTSRHLGQIGVPTLVIHGEEDSVVPLETASVLSSSIPGARLVTIPHAGHVSNQEQPDVFNAAVREFLGGVETARNAWG